MSTDLASTPADPLAGFSEFSERLQRADRHPAAVYLARLAPGSRPAIRDALNVAAGILTSGRLAGDALPWHLLRYQHVHAIRTAGAEKYAPATVNKMLAAVRGVLKEAWRLQLLAGDDYQRAADVPGVKASLLPSGRALSRGELAALLAACADDPTPMGARDGALCSVLYGGGLRRSEAVGLDLGDFDPDSGALTVRGGKGNKDRIAYVTNGGGEAVRDWLAIRGDAPGPLFTPAKDGRILIRRLTPNAVRAALVRRAAEARVSHFSPHDLRRTFISDLLDAGADVSAVQKLAGHANVQTTLRYDRRPEAAKRKAASLLHVPYTGRRG